MSGTRTRFAPSPTGSLHVGGVRTALYALLAARRDGGTFVLRIEDTDQARSTEEAAKGIVRDLRWVGLYWDEGPERDHPQFGPYFQSQRLELYHREVGKLLAAGKAYHAWETDAELGAERKAAEAAKQNFRYRRRAYTAEQLRAYEAEARKPVVRLAAPGHDVTVHDVVLGEVTVEADELDDFVLIKADGFPTYHFAVVVDDHHMDIDLVLRGQEHLKNTHRHLLIYEAFGWDPPAHGHLPSVLNTSGEGKMSKRDKAKAAREAARAAHKARGAGKDDWSWLATEASLDPAELAKFMAKANDSVATAEAIGRALGVELPLIEVVDYRRAGILPEALLNYLALVGWSPGDDRQILSLDDMRAAFSLDRVNKTAGRFDGDKLLWVNAEYMKSLPEDRLLQHLASWLEVRESPIAALDEAHRRLLVAMYRPRARTFVDIERIGAFLFRAPTAYDPKQVAKHLDPDGLLRLRTARGALSTIGDWTASAVRRALDALSASTDVPVGKYAQPVRIALTGDGVSPELPETLEFLGRDESLARIDRLLAQRATPPA